jgi:hypothetical protein
VRPIDDELDRFWHNRLPLYAIYPSPALELFGSASITGPAAATVERNLYERGRTLLSRIIERLRRGACNLRLRTRDRLLAQRLKELKAGQTI